MKKDCKTRPRPLPMRIKAKGKRPWGRVLSFFALLFVMVPLAFIGPFAWAPIPDRELDIAQAGLADLSGSLVDALPPELGQVVAVLQPMESHWQDVDPASLRAPRASLEEGLTVLSSQVPDGFAFVLIDPARGWDIQVNPEETFEAASIYKLFMVAAVLEAKEEGRMDLGPTDYRAMDLAIRLSDNATAEYLGQTLGWDQVEAFVIRHGYAQTTFNPLSGGRYTGRIETTAGDVACFLEDLIQGKLLSPEDTAYLLHLLLGQEHAHALSLGLDEDTSFLHKTGWLNRVFHDAGYVVSDGRLVLVVSMTGGWTADAPAASEFYGQLGEAVEAYTDASAFPLAIHGAYPLPVYDVYGQQMEDFTQAQTVG